MSKIRHLNNKLLKSPPSESNPSCLLLPKNLLVHHRDQLCKFLLTYQPFEKISSECPQIGDRDLGGLTLTAIEGIGSDAIAGICVFLEEVTKGLFIFLHDELYSELILILFHLQIKVRDFWDSNLPLKLILNLPRAKLVDNLRLVLRVLYISWASILPLIATPSSTFLFCKRLLVYCLILVKCSLSFSSYLFWSIYFYYKASLK